MTFTQSIATCMGKYGTFKGRAGRSEFWWFYLFGVLLDWGAQVLDFLAYKHEDLNSVLNDVGPNYVLVTLALFVPSIAVGARRLHDVGRSGWWQLILFTIIGIIPLIIWAAQEGSKTDNEFGAPISSDNGDEVLGGS